MIIQDSSSLPDQPQCLAVKFLRFLTTGGDDRVRSSDDLARKFSVIISAPTSHDLTNVPAMGAGPPNQGAVFLFEDISIACVYYILREGASVPEPHPAALTILPPDSVYELAALNQFMFDVSASLYQKWTEFLLEARKHTTHFWEQPSSPNPMSDLIRSLNDTTQ